MGSVYRPKLKSGQLQATYRIKYVANGKTIIESTGLTDEREARRVLKEREGRAATGQPILPRVDKVKYEEIAKDLRDYYRTTGKRNLTEAGKRLAHLDRYFTGQRIVTLDPPRITGYVSHRQGQQAANGTINRELAILGRMLRLAFRNNKLVRLPDFGDLKLKEADPRSGFFEADQFEWVRKRLPEDLHVAVTVAYTYGWRTQSEVLALELRHLDLDAGTLRLDPGMTKNGQGRVVYLTPELKALLGAQVARVKALEKKLKRIIPFLFPHLDGAAPQLLGTQKKDFRKAWLTACKDAGVPGKLRHDLRRTAARNLVRLGVPERVAMTVTGHLTRSVFERYNIVSPADLQDAARRLSASQGLSEAH
ncbi:MAG TPA: site-specific integrase [Candidatus Nitrosotalea sp.]|nr:site-specific integrase [Candidatus Nitrosotalea sp.]